MPRPPFVLVITVLAAMAAGCASNKRSPTVVPPTQSAVQPVDFSGSWERNYSRGGDIQENVSRMARRLSRNVYQGSTPNSRRGYTSSSPSLGPIIAMARLADAITRTDTLLIEQDEVGIEVEREEDFALTCEFNNTTAQQFYSPLGHEVCGWDGTRMVFHVALPDGVSITHRLVMAPSGNELNVATTVTSPASSTPYTLNRFYTRFEPLPSPYVCEQTLSRKRVCEFRPSDEREQQRIDSPDSGTP
ncbi:MAG: hypothetical protein AAF465_14845 [Pseudomonadota bacterium]